MKHVIFLILSAVLIPGLVWAQDGRDRDRGVRHSGHGRVAHRAVHSNVIRAPHRAAVTAQFRSLGIHSYPKPIAHGNLLVAGREHSAIAFPNRGPNGVAIHANVFSRTNFSGNPVIRAHMAIVTGNAFHANIVAFNAHETIANHYYWHTYGGFNYCHYYDPWGYHWYGWYLGNNYFWTRWYSNHFWWYDPVYYRWCYWHDGGWWWQDPNTTTIYVYNNGNYVSSAANPGASAPQSSAKSADYFSKDSTREVRVVAGGDAFLYDISGDAAFKPIFLGSNVTDVKFSNTDNGGSLQIMLMLKDGTFSTFDREGNPLNGSNGGNTMAPQDQDAPAPGANSSGPGGAPQPPPSGANPPPAPVAN